MPYAIEIKPLIEARNSLGCHLQSINGIAGCFNFTGGAKQFDDLVKHHDFHTGTIVSISTDNNHAATVRALRARKFVLLGTQPGAHGDYKMELWGHGFTLPKKEKVNGDRKHTRLLYGSHLILIRRTWREVRGYSS